MNRKDDQHLEAAIDRELKQLPEIAAPDKLIARVMAKVGTPAPKRSREYSEPLGALRPFHFAAIAVLFGVLCLGLWYFLSTPFFLSAVGQLRQSFSAVAVVWNTIPVIAGAVVMAIRKINPGLIALGLMLISLAYATCIGVGSAMVRAVVVRR